MLKEFAVDPRVIASSFDTCRYLVSLFGADKGRLISRFPKKWKEMAFAVANELPPGRNQKRVVEYINAIGKDSLTLIPSGRPYLSPADPWVDNAIAAHQRIPFHAIVTDRDDPPNQIIDIGNSDENTPLLAAIRAGVVSREAADLAQAAALLLKTCRTLRLVDPYVDPRRPKWLKPLTAMLALITDIRKVECEYHLLDRDASPPTEEMIRRLVKLKDVIPAGGSLRVIRWRERAGGERFHRRYLLTENAGLSYEGGLDEEVGAQQTTDVFLLDRDMREQRWAEYNLDSSIYDLMQPVLVVDAEGQVREENH